MSTKQPSDDYIGPVQQRPAWRRSLGRWFFISKRWLQWLTERSDLALTRSEEALPFLHFAHSTPTLRQLPAVEMQLQINKITNLRIAAKCLDGLLIHPHKTLSYWYQVGFPGRYRGFLPGLVLQNGKIGQATGGGLCQSGNLIHWMALHTDLQITERWRHSYDVFPDAERRVPFGSGATLAYNYLDLRLHNPTKNTYQLRIWVTDTHLHGEIRSDAPVLTDTQIEERAHRMVLEPWGGYSRHNVLVKLQYDLESGQLLSEAPVVENHALMCYQPFLGTQER